MREPVKSQTEHSHYGDFFCASTSSGLIMSYCKELVLRYGVKLTVKTYLVKYTAAVNVTLVRSDFWDVRLQKLASSKVEPAKCSFGRSRAVALDGRSEADHYGCCEVVGGAEDNNVGFTSSDTVCDESALTADARCCRSGGGGGCEQ
jgi:hypothetical protein